MKKFFKRSILAILLLLGAFILLNFKHVVAFPKIISAFYAKEYCSCFFVVGHEKQYCHDYTRQWVPISDFQLDEKKQTVTVTGLFQTTQARYLGQRDGCQIQ